MKATLIAKVETGQDIAIYGDYMFDFVAHGVCLGECNVYRMDSFAAADGNEVEAICRFTLDKTDVIIPHCNSACFGTEFYEEGDEFPLLYLNVYNNYHKCDVRNEGICCVYRIMREGNSFKSELVQLIEVGFVENTELWKSYQGTEDRRPYGNFIIDRENSKYYGYVLRDKTQTTRFFSFDLPKVSEGEIDDRFGIRVKTITEADINYFFDGDHAYMQGGCVHNGMIYSVSGGRHTPEIRIIDPIKRTQRLCFDFLKLGIEFEPEGIEFYKDVCYLVVGYGNTYILEDME